MNLFSHSELASESKLAIFLAVFVPTIVLAFYTVAKSWRLSEFLDVLADEKAGWRARLQTLLGDLGAAPRAPARPRAGVSRHRPATAARL
jgi:hypothetical protein